jgi:hypothetical protein
MAPLANLLSLWRTPKNRNFSFMTGYDQFFPPGSFVTAKASIGFTYPTWAVFTIAVASQLRHGLAQ